MATTFRAGDHIKYDKEFCGWRARSYPGNFTVLDVEAVPEIERHGVGHHQWLIVHLPCDIGPSKISAAYFMRVD